MSTSEPIGLIGLGAMGGALAETWLRRGRQVVGFDTDSRTQRRFTEAGGLWASSAAAVAQKCRTIMLLVRDVGDVEAALFGSEGVVSAGKLNVSLWLASTAPPSYAANLELRLADARMNLLDGPVSGGVEGAAAGTLTVIASGADLAFASVEPFAAQVSSRIFRVGTRAGPASTIKMINQALTAAHIALSAEALALGVRAGVDASMLYSVICESAGSSRMFEKRAPLMLAGNTTPSSTLAIFLKDMDIVLDCSRATGARAPLAEAVRTILAAAAGAEGIEASDTTLFDFYRRDQGAVS